MHPILQGPINPILLDPPEQIETDRLLIRAPRPGDGQAFYEGVLESLAVLRAWPASIPWSVFDPSVVAYEIFCRLWDADYRARRNFPMLVFVKSSGVYAGFCGLTSFDWSVPKCEIGYWCRAQFQGKGMTTEAVKAVSTFALSNLGVRRIVSMADQENQASRKVAENAGYELEGILRNERKAPDGTLRNTCLYALAN